MTLRKAGGVVTVHPLPSIFDASMSPPIWLDEHDQRRPTRPNPPWYHRHMTPLPTRFCAVCGLVLLTMTEVESHKVHALPLEHIHVEVDESQPLAQINISAATSSGTFVSDDLPPGQGFTGMEVARWVRKQNDDAQRMAAIRFYQMNGES